MAFGVVPPPLGTEVRNLGEVGEMFYDRPLHLGLLAGPDYSTALVSVTNPELVTRAEKTLAPHGAIHGYTTMKDLMDALNPLTGKIYLEALEWTRVGRIMCMLMFGKFPHPSTIVPGGMSTTVTTSTFNEYYMQLGKILDWCKVICRIWDNSEVYDATYANCNSWGEKRWSSPGVIIEGKLVTTKLTDINIGMEEFIEHSFYDDWTKVGPQRYKTDPLGNPLSPYHAWNKTTLPKPTGDGIRMLLPRHALPETELFWPLPRTLCALERNRARAYSLAFTATIGMNCLLKAFEYWRQGETKVHTPFKIPRDERMAVGFWEAGRGYLVHHITMDKGKIVNYQINTPSTLNASPTDPFGGLGP